MAILDGKQVPDTDIDPAKHRFIGVFRDPTFNMFEDRALNPRRPFDVYVCSCNHHLWTREEIFSHWQKGHMDKLIYETIIPQGLKPPWSHEME